MKLLILSLTLLFITPSIAQCNFKTTIKPDGDVIKYFNPKPVIRQPGYEVGVSIYKNTTTNIFMLNISVLFKSMKQQKLNEDVILQTTNVKGIRLAPFVFENVTMNGRELAIGLYKIEEHDFNELKQNSLKSVFFYLDGNLIGSTVTENNSILQKELNCFEAKEDRFDNNSANSFHDVQFDLDPFDETAQYKYANTPSTEVARGTDFGESIYDENFFPNISLNDDGDINELIGENRSHNREVWVVKALVFTGILVFAFIIGVIVKRHVK